MMANATKKFFISLFLVILTFVTITASTFAWLSLALVNTVNTINFSVTAGANFYVSLGDKNANDIFEISNWQSQLSSEDMKEYINKANFANVTSRNGYSILNRDGTKAKEDSYFRIPLYFKADNVPYQYGLLSNVSLYLGDYVSNVNYEDALSNVVKGSYIVSKGIRQYADIDYVNRYGDKMIASVSLETYYAKDAIRISIAPVEFDNISMSDDDLRYINNAKIFDLSDEPQYGYANASDDIYATPRGCISYEINKFAELVTDLPESEPTTIKLHDVEEDEYLFTFNKIGEGEDAIYYGKCYLYIWLEGWDVDCYDVVLRDYIYGSIQFKIINHE